jgi:hypothetical protein
MAGDFVPLMGYVPNRAGTDAFLATLPRPMLAQAGPDLVLDENRDVFLGQYHVLVGDGACPATSLPPAILHFVERQRRMAAGS